MQKVNIFWFRRDLRLNDNAGLYHALKGDYPVVPVFIFDKNILNDLEDKADRRVEFIHAAINEIQHKLPEFKSTLEVFYDNPVNAFKKLLKKYTIIAIYTNEDYEQYAIDRDKEVENLLKNYGANFYSYKDQVIFSKDEIVKDNGEPYTIFTPYSKKWKAKLNDFYLKFYSTENFFNNFYKQVPQEIPSLNSMGFEKVNKPFPSKGLEKELIKKYDKSRNFPGIEGTSKLSVHLRFGTISIRNLAVKAKQLNDVFLNELIWRDFYQMIFWQFPHVRKGGSFRKEFDRIQWRNNENEFQLWCEGKTGYPIVDAGMRELNETGYMHNRVRMIVASFLTKHLLIDWRWGETYFAKKLLDYDYASNNGGWQWAAGSGCDAVPYFRIFNPTLQTKKFDKDLNYIKKWVPELNNFNYAQPIIQHEEARKRALEVFGKAVKM
ncbi:MAG: cryptochrome/photolyase family protein [Chitinophagaceae bacterium]